MLLVLLACQVVPIQAAGSDPRSADNALPRGSNRHQVLILIDEVEFVVGQDVSSYYRLSNLTQTLILDLSLDGGSLLSSVPVGGLSEEPLTCV